MVSLPYKFQFFSPWSSFCHQFLGRGNWHSMVSEVTIIQCPFAILCTNYNHDIKICLLSPFSSTIQHLSYHSLSFFSVVFFFLFMYALQRTILLSGFVTAIDEYMVICLNFEVFKLELILNLYGFLFFFCVWMVMFLVCSLLIRWIREYSVFKAHIFYAFVFVAYSS